MCWLEKIGQIWASVEVYHSKLGCALWVRGCFWILWNQDLSLETTKSKEGSLWAQTQCQGLRHIKTSATVSRWWPYLAYCTKPLYVRLMPVSIPESLVLQSSAEPGSLTSVLLSTPEEFWFHRFGSSLQNFSKFYNNVDVADLKTSMLWIWE